MFYKTGVPINFAKFTGKRWCWSLFSIKFQAFIPGVFVWTFQNFKKNFFYWTRLSDSSWMVFCKKDVFLFVIRLQALGLQRYSKETPTRIVSCKFRKAFMNAFLIAWLRTAALNEVIKQYFLLEIIEIKIKQLKLKML